jgi:hypothetical protein
MSRAVTTVNVIAADDDTGEFLRHEIHFVRCLRATKQTERPRATPGDSGTETFGRTAESLFPSRRPQLTLLTHQWFGEADI